MRGIAIALVVSMGASGFLPEQAGAAEEEELPAPVEVGGQRLMTADGLQLSATFRPGTRGQESVPVILLHMWKGSRKDYAGLAEYLQRQGHAVLVPDLRGHGDSAGGPLTGRKLDPAKLSKNDFYEMRYGDMELLRRFLVEKNDAGELNLNKLCIVGAEMGAVVGVYYALNDWTQIRREANRAAAAQDVKGLVLISPDWDFRGMPLNKPLGNPLVRSAISTMIVVGKEDSRSLGEANRVHNVLKKFHVDPEKLEPEDRDKMDLFYIQAPTKLQGTKMLGVRGLRVEWAVARFIELRLVKQDYPWYRRGRGG
jgi:pimeloyl-ACP methyl ester carboxylesterase